jgi:hypothetical protein
MTAFDTFVAINDAELEGLVRRLERAEEDLRERLVDRVAVLDDASRPFSDPLYQRLHWLLGGLNEQRVAAEAELARRAAAPAP